MSTTIEVDDILLIPISPVPLLSVKQAKPAKVFITGKGNMTIFFSVVPLSNPHCVLKPYCAIG